MSFTALKYKFATKPSWYAAITLLVLCCIPLGLLIFLFPLDLVAYLIIFMLLLCALKLSWLISHQTYLFDVSEQGDIKLMLDQQRAFEATMTAASFYNSWFIFIHISTLPSLGRVSAQKKGYLVIYRDSLTQAEYYLLARIINALKAR